LSRQARDKHRENSKKQITFCQLFLCLPRACLGKDVCPEPVLVKIRVSIIESIKLKLRKNAFSAPPSRQGHRSAGLRRCDKTGFFGAFPLCLSRACLGQIVVFIHKWLKRPVVFSPHFDAAEVTVCSAVQPAVVNAPVPAPIHMREKKRRFRSLIEPFQRSNQLTLRTGRPPSLNLRGMMACLAGAGTRSASRGTGRGRPSQRTESDGRSPIANHTSSLF
jgi:hypothetical protein